MTSRVALVSLWAVLGLANCSRVSEVLTPVPSEAGVPVRDAASDAPSPPDAQTGEAGTLTTSSIDAGDQHSCATLRGALYCWGDNQRGQLGVGDTTARPSPTRVGSLGDWAEVTTGKNHSCARRSDGSAYCFGANDIGQLGTAPLAQSLEPRRVTLPSPAAHIVTEANHVCVITDLGALLGWGENLEGELGQGDAPPFVSQFPPVAIGTDQDWTAVDTGQGDTCGLRGSGDLYCWGRNTSAQLGLGDGALQQTRAPTLVGTTTYRRIQAGQDHSCGIRNDGALDCWGQNQFGNLGTGDRAAHSSAIQIGTKQDWQAISLDTFHSCAIDLAQHLYCWGRNVEGQLGTGDNDDRLSPSQVPGEGFVQVAVGRFHTCALKADDSVWCTGADESGELGLGTTDRTATFSQLSFP